MLLIRQFETAIHRLFLSRRGPRDHAICTPARRRSRSACAWRSQPTTTSTGTYRGHGHALAKGTAPDPSSAEMLGRGDRRLRRARGLDERDRPRARADRLLRDRRRLDRGGARCRRCRRSARAGCRVAFFGDGATNQGYFHECLNMAAVLLAPGRVRMREQPLRRVHADGRATAGGDIAAVPPPTTCRRRSSTETTCGRSTPPPPRPSAGRAPGTGPTLLECRTYRHYGHSKSDPAHLPDPGGGRSLAGA